MKSPSSDKSFLAMNTGGAERSRCGGMGVSLSLASPAAALVRDDAAEAKPQGGERERNMEIRCLGLDATAVH